MSVHVYCQPYDECDIYDPEQGTVRRVRLDYDSVPPRWSPRRAKASRRRGRDGS